MSPHITDVRLSAIWFTFSDALLQDPVPDVPFAFLGRDTTWAARFAALRDYGADHDGLVPPWPRHRAKHFWSLYLNKPPHDVDPYRAWRHFVPLRVQRPVAPVAGWLPGRVAIEGMLYPHGIGLVVDFRLGPRAGEQAWTIENAVDEAMNARSGGAFDVRIDGNQASMKLESLAAATLSSLARTAWGPTASPAIGDPYTVVTFVGVEGVDPAKAPENGGEVHRALEAVTRWSASWKFDGLPELAGVTVRDPKMPPGHIHYVRRHGRATWYPALAAPDLPRKQRRLLGCYYRNQVLAALQVESMGRLVDHTVARLKANAQPPLAQRKLARDAAILLGRLYGAIDTYRSLACQDHIDNADFLSALTYLRDIENLGPLHASSQNGP